MFFRYIEIAVIMFREARYLVWMSVCGCVCVHGYVVPLVRTWAGKLHKIFNRCVELVSAFVYVRVGISICVCILLQAISAGKLRRKEDGKGRMGTIRVRLECF